MTLAPFRIYLTLFVASIFLTVSCAPRTIPSSEVQLPGVTNNLNADIPPGFVIADGSRQLTFPEDFGAHEDFRTEWWYYTGNLQTTDGRHFGFELTIFRVSLLPPTVELPSDSHWYSHSVYLAHFALSDISADRFYAFERYSRPGPGLAGAQADPYRVWLEDWSIAEERSSVFHLQAAQGEIALNLTLTDEMGIVLHGENGFTRGGKNVDNTAYYYSQPRLHADGFVQVNGVDYPVSGLAWKDHEFSSGTLDKNQIGWDWFSLQFEDGSALMLFQLREQDGRISSSSGGTFIDTPENPQPIQNTDFKIIVLNEWRSPYTQGTYPGHWEIQLNQPNCLLRVQPWMADQELHFPEVTYWEGAVHFDGTCNGAPARGNGYVELTGYAGNLPLR